MWLHRWDRRWHSFQLERKKKRQWHDSSVLKWSKHLSIILHAVILEPITVCQSTNHQNNQQRNNNRNIHRYSSAVRLNRSVFIFMVFYGFKWLVLAGMQVRCMTLLVTHAEWSLYSCFSGQCAHSAVHQTPHPYGFLGLRAKITCKRNISLFK